MTLLDSLHLLRQAYMVVNEHVGRMSSYESQRSSRGIERTKFAIVESVLQVPVVKPLLEHHEDDRQQLPSSGTDRFARPLLPFLLLVELHQRRLRLIDHREHRADGDSA